MTCPSNAKAVTLLMILCVLLLPGQSIACTCETSHSTCKEARASDVIFIGTVDLIEPNFLNRWNTASSAALQQLNESYLAAKDRASPAELTRFKEVFLRTFPELPEDRRAKLRTAKTVSEVGSLFYTALDRGKRIRLEIKTLFKNQDDDNGDDKKPGDRDDPTPPHSVEIFTPFGDCGFDFQVGETYLVYANSDEDSDYLFTGSCTRTRRLSDAGDDLAFLYFLQEHPEQSSRLEGFTTTDRHSQLDREPLHDRVAITSPVPGLIVALQSETWRRYAQADANGRFLFDGLPEGEYKLFAYAAGFPLDAQLLAGPQSFHVEEKSCTQQVLVLTSGH